MKFALFYHSLLSDWNHGNAHFLRGIATELLSRGHEVSVYESEESWSRQNLTQEHGHAPIQQFWTAYPALDSVVYDLRSLDLDRVASEADAVLVHEWNEPALVNRLGALRHRRRGFRLYFHNTHHRLITDPERMNTYDLHRYDGVLAYGKTLQDCYLRSHVPRRPYVKALPGIPTIRVFEALACAIPLASAPWDDVENLFHPDHDYLLARTGKAMKRCLLRLLDNPDCARFLAAHGLETIRARHTCRHRVDELLEIIDRTPLD